MANLVQLRMLENLNGFLLVDKPQGLAFSTVVKTVKRLFNLVKVGHGGSLDAMASGLLVLLINDANRLVGDVMGADRLYTGTMRLGRATTTHDIEGEPIGEIAPVPADLAARLERTLPEFRGDIFQTEPRFCSVRREGSAAYEIADTGEHAPFMTHVYRLEATPRAASDLVDFSVTATKGLLVRTLVNDLGLSLGCGAALASVRRERVGRFTVEDAIPFDRLLETSLSDFAARVLPLSKALGS